MASRRSATRARSTLVPSFSRSDVAFDVGEVTAEVG
jgi:hypothetical protein